MSIELTGRLLLPQHSEGEIIDAGTDWDIAPLVARGATRPTVWGGGPRPTGTPTISLAANLWHRERALARLRRPRDRYRIQRWRPGRLTTGGLRNQLRDLARAGAIVESQPGARRLLDDIALEAGAVDAVGRFDLTTGGILHARIATTQSGTALLKVGLGAGSENLLHEARALDQLAEGTPATIPRPLGSGRVGPAAWSLQTIAPGRRPRRLRRQLAREAAAFCAALPRIDETHQSLARDLKRLTAVVPGVASDLEQLARRAQADLAELPAIHRHGDFWSANLLSTSRRLSGVVDWDAWDPAGVPGADLLHLVTREEARLTSQSLGAIWQQRPWQWPAFTSLAAPYWSALHVAPTAGALEAVGIAWWLNQVSGSVHRLPRLAGEPRWMEENVHAVLATLRV